MGSEGTKSEFANLLDYTKPDIFCGVESFFYGIKQGENPETDHITSSEIFPPQYNEYRNDRNSDGEGSFFSYTKTMFLWNYLFLEQTVKLAGLKYIS